MVKRLVHSIAIAVFACVLPVTAQSLPPYPILLLDPDIKVTTSVDPFNTTDWHDFDGFQVAPNTQQFSISIQWRNNNPYGYGVEMNMNTSQKPVVYFAKISSDKDTIKLGPDGDNDKLNDFNGSLQLDEGQTGWNRQDRYIVTYKPDDPANKALVNFNNVMVCVGGGVLNDSTSWEFDEVIYKSKSGMSERFAINLLMVKITELRVEPSSRINSSTPDGQLEITAIYDSKLDANGPQPILTFKPLNILHEWARTGIGSATASNEGKTSDFRTYKWTYDYKKPATADWGKTKEERLTTVTVEGGWAESDPNKIAQSQKFSLSIDFQAPKLVTIQPLGAVDYNTTRFSFNLTFSEAMNKSFTLHEDSIAIAFTDTLGNPVNNVFDLRSVQYDWPEDSLCTVTYTVIPNKDQPYVGLVRIASDSLGTDVAGNKRPADNKISALVSVDQRLIGVKATVRPVVVQRAMASGGVVTMTLNFGQEMDTTATPPNVEFWITQNYTYQRWNNKSSGHDVLIMRGGHWFSPTEYIIEYTVDPSFATGADASFSLFNIDVLVLDAMQAEPHEILDSCFTENVFSIDFNLPSCRVIYWNLTPEGTIPPGGLPIPDNEKLIVPENWKKIFFQLEYDRAMDPAFEPQIEFQGLLNWKNVLGNRQTIWSSDSICNIYYDLTPQAISQEVSIVVSGAKSRPKGSDRGTVQGVSSSSQPFVLDMLPITAEYRVFDTDNHEITTVRCSNKTVKMTVKFNQPMYPVNKGIVMFPQFRYPFLKEKSMSWSIDKKEAYISYTTDGQYVISSSNVKVMLSDTLSNLYGKKIIDNAPFDKTLTFISNPPRLGAMPVVKSISCHGANDAKLQFEVKPGTGTEPYIHELYTETDTLSGTGPVAGWENLIPGNYSVVITGADQCYFRYDAEFSDPDSLLVRADITKQIERTTNTDTSLNIGAIGVTATGGTAPLLYYYERVGDPLGEYESDKAVIENLGPGKYCIRVIDQNGCVASPSDTILMVNRTTPSLFMPEGGANGQPQVFMEENRRLQIFDRTGTMMFDDKTGTGWDGKYNGRPVKPGVYFYIVVLKDGTEKKGTIEVFKKY